MKRRRKARELALEALYRFEITNDEPDSILSGIFSRTRSDREVKRFTRALVEYTIREQARIDEIISRTAENWILSRIAVIDRNILRLAICEILYFSEIPFKVSIDEAIELAKKYSTEESGKFVNGILDKVVHQV